MNFKWTLKEDDSRSQTCSMGIQMGSDYPKSIRLKALGQKFSFVDDLSSWIVFVQKVVD